MSKQNQIKIPKYVLEGNQNIPEDLKKVLDYFRDCGNKNYQVCLVGEKESVAKDLKEKGFKGKYPFIHLDNQSLNEDYPFLPISVKNAIRRTNKLISNPENDFNITDLGIHTLGLVPISEIKPLNDLGYGLLSWSGIQIYLMSKRKFKARQGERG
tara:strand:- start:77 stop:541 length:465 start_codon:yes stop_codon:yes gene_type:complete